MIATTVPNQPKGQKKKVRRRTLARCAVQVGATSREMVSCVVWCGGINHDRISRVKAIARTMRGTTSRCNDSIFDDSVVSLFAVSVGI